VCLFILVVVANSGDSGNLEAEVLVKEKISENAVMVFSKSYCPYCKKAKELLTKYGVKFDSYEINVESNGAQVQKVLEKITGQSTVPNIFIGTKHIGGSDKLAALDRDGELVKILQKAGITIPTKTEL